jgi:hypothetical protein
LENQQTTSGALHVALQLYNAGYRQLLPIIPPGATLSDVSRVQPDQCGKIPGKRQPDGTWTGFAKWPKHVTSRADVGTWSKWDGGFCLQTKEHPAVDVDVSDEATAGAIADAVAAYLGGTCLRRYGRAPRVAIPCRTDEPFQKVRFVLKNATHEAVGVVEILGVGNQLVIEGIHPKTGQPYRWDDGKRRGGAEVLAAHSPESLPLLNVSRLPGLRETIVQAVAPFNLTVEDHGAMNGVRDASKVDQPSLRAPSIGVLSEAVAAIPNDDSFGRTEYIRMLYAVRAAAGPEHYVEGLEIAQDWAARWTDGYNDSGQVADDYASCPPPAKVGWDFLLSTAQRYGCDTAVLEFEADVAPTEFERIASLHRRLDKAFFLALSSLAPTADLGTFLGSLRVAAERRDPLDYVFRTKVWPTARRLRFDASDQALFAFSLNADNGAGLTSVSDESAALLTRAAWALIAPTSVLLGQQSSTPGTLLCPGSATREWLVEGWIPRPSVSAIIGAPGKGKSFAAVELCGRIAKAVDATTAALAPEQFAGRDVEHGSVVYCASEDVDGWRERAERWEGVNGPAPNLRIVSGVPPLSRPADALSFMLGVAEQMERAGLPRLLAVVIDVFRAAFTGKENDSDDVGAAMATAHAIARTLGVAVVLVHHTPRDDDARPRGSNAFEAALDFMAAVTKPKYGNLVTWTVSRNKSGPAGHQAQWEIGENGVLKSCPLRTSATAAVSQGEHCARIAAATIRELARASLTVTRPALVVELARREPDLFGPNVARSTAQMRLKRALGFAADNNWIEEKRPGAYAAGPQSPPGADSIAEAAELSATPASLDDLE